MPAARHPDGSRAAGVFIRKKTPPAPWPAAFTDSSLQHVKVPLELGEYKVLALEHTSGVVVLDVVAHDRDVLQFHEVLAGPWRHQRDVREQQERVAVRVVNVNPLRRNLLPPPRGACREDKTLFVMSRLLIGER